MQEEFPGIDGRYYVDTGPVMEKAWAQRAGIGWIGKHTNLITEDKGSWLFLAVIISTLELDPDGQATDHCGTCTLCLEACPTGAITEAYVVDSNRCLSYLTIEHRGTLEASLAEKMDGWIYGCDICQDVCPWNEKFAIVTDEPSFLPRDGNLAPSLRQWSEMTEEEFRTMSRGSPMTRTKYSGLIRNVRAAVKRVSAEFEQPNP
jgi:epoxyqueuosine reductase